jgi:hypothetical protein
VVSVDTSKKEPAGQHTGWAGADTGHDTARFAVACLRRWWGTVGRETYTRAHRLLITANAGDSHGCRTRAWRGELATLAAETGLEIDMCQLPPGTSKWNTIEHRLFSHLTMDWRGLPLFSHQVVVDSVGQRPSRTIELFL